MKVLKLGDPWLRKRAAVVNDHGSRSFLEDVELLKIALEEEGGMGIAAPQIGIDRQLFLIHSRPNKRYPFAPESELMVIINPQILSASEEKELDWEGCLSVPDQRARVWRNFTINVSYENLSGEILHSSFEGFMARIFQHEYDHLQGILFIDRVQDKSEIINEREYLRMIEMG